MTLNIALVNEFAIIFRRMVLIHWIYWKPPGVNGTSCHFGRDAGGHCIGVDLYYLTHKAEQLGYHPQLVLAGRRINDCMGGWLAEQLVLGLAERRQAVVGKSINVGAEFRKLSGFT